MLELVKDAKIAAFHFNKRLRRLPILAQVFLEEQNADLTSIKQMQKLLELTQVYVETIIDRSELSYCALA